MKVAIVSMFPLHVIPEFGETFRRSGHYATWLPQIVEGFAGFPDLDAHWIVLSDRVSAPRKATWKGQTFHILPTAPRHRAWTFFAKDRRAIRQLLDEIQPDLVHGWGSEDVHGFAAATSGRPNIVSMQGILSYYVLKNRMHPRIYLQTLAELYILRKADCITVESAWGRGLLRRRSPRRPIELVEYGVQPHFLDIPWAPDPQKPAAIFIGTVTPRKGIQDAVEAFRDPRLAGAELWVLGNDGGPFFEGLHARSTPNVKWLGRLSSVETAELLSRAWCLVLPTRADTSPNVVKEARVIGLPVISTPCGGQTTYIQPGENGYLVNPGDISTLAQRLSELLGDFEKTKIFGAAHHQEHRAALHPLETARKFHLLYQKMTGA